MSKLSVIILPAGKGTRMKSELSKLLHKVGNLEMVNHVINSAKKLNADEITVVCSEENIEEIKKNIDEKIITTIQYDRNGTAGAAKIGYESLKNKSNNILILYGDVPLVRAETYQKLVNALETDDTAIADLAFHTCDIKNKYGRLITKGDCLLKQIVEYKDATDEIKCIDLCNSGLMAIRGGLLGGFLSKVNNSNASKEYYLTDIIEIAQKDNLKCKYIVGTEDEVMGVNSRYELSIAERIFQDTKRREFMDAGVTLIDPESVYFSYDTQIENDVTIEPNVTIMTGVKIHKNVKIKSFTYLEDSEIHEAADAGPFARLRGGAVLQKKAHIGNFVEIKKSNIGEAVKIGHLTYIGDAEIGKGTNIGAGTITCNYDGFSKFKTKIGESCFIGSNTIMVAPISIGDRSITGAGSVVTKNIEEDDIIIARGEQKALKKKAIDYRNKRCKK